MRLNELHEDIYKMLFVKRENYDYFGQVNLIFYKIILSQ